MILVALYIVLIFFGFIVPGFLLFFTFFNIRATFFGAPYVATSNKIIGEILKQADLKKGSRFLELGSGDGRVVKTAVKNYQVVGEGVDINPFLTLWARFLTKVEGVTDLEFKTQNITETDFSRFPVIFMFLTPQATKKFKQKFETECRRGTVLISHGFRIPGFEKKLIKKMNRTPFPTYFYKM